MPFSRLLFLLRLTETNSLCHLTTTGGHAEFDSRKRARASTKRMRQNDNRDRLFVAFFVLCRHAHPRYAAVPFRLFRSLCFERVRARHEKTNVSFVATEIAAANSSRRWSVSFDLDCESAKTEPLYRANNNKIHVAK